MQPEHGQLALDLCCGTGRHIVPLNDMGLDVIGGDLSPALLKLARENMGVGQPLIRLDMKSLPFASNSFDLVANFFTAFGYFQKDEDNFQVIKEVARILKPGGWFFFDFLNAEQVKQYLKEKEGIEETELTDGTKWEIERKLIDSGRRAFKKQTSLSERKRATYVEDVRLYTREELENVLLGNHFRLAQVLGDYIGGSFRSQTSPRLIFLAQKK